jgi:hypothetical protein
MALDSAQLATNFIQVFKDGKDAANSDVVAQALADAIHAYVSAATVNGVTVNVVDSGGNPLGSGTQTTPVTIT